MSAEMMESVLQTLMSSDNQLRGQAELAFNDACVNQFAEVVTSLVQLLSGHPDQVIRMFAAVLLRRQLSFSEAEAWGQLGEDIQEGGTWWAERVSIARVCVCMCVCVCVACVCVWSSDTCKIRLRFVCVVSASMVQLSDQVQGGGGAGGRQRHHAL